MGLWYPKDTELERSNFVDKGQGMQSLTPEELKHLAELDKD
ncbi:hypothetical protein Tco_0549688, partial [Tanacetum coccineum]